MWQGAAVVAPPVNTLAPAISGTPPYYVGSAINGVAGTYDQSVTLSYAYELSVDGGPYTAIPLATLINWIVENKYQYGNLRLAETALGIGGSTTTYSNVIALFDIRAVGGNLVSWKDADDDRTIFATGSSITQFNDRINTAYNVSQSNGAFQPVTGNTYTGPGGIARNVVRSTLDMLWNTNPFIYALTDKTIYYVFKGPAQSGERAFYCERSTGTTAQNMQISCNSGTGLNDVRIFFRNNANASFLNVVDTSNWLDNTRRLMTQLYTTTTYENKIDGVTTMSGAYVKSGSMTLNSHSLLGMRTTTALAGPDGDFCEMLVFDTIHNSTQQALVKGMIDAKW